MINLYIFHKVKTVIIIIGLENPTKSPTNIQTSQCRRLINGHGHCLIDAENSEVVIILIRSTSIPTKTPITHFLKNKKKKMAKNCCESILCFFFFIISFSAISVSAQTCDKTAGTFKPNSTYDNNRRLIFSTLASNVTARDGYFNGSIGLGPDRVYAMGMCAPGAEPDACSHCIKTTSEGLLQICLNQTDAFSWSGEETLCVVRYSSKSFSGLLVLEPHNVLYNFNDIRKEIQKEFDSVWDGLMPRMIGVASSSVRTNSSSTSSLSLSSKYYAKDVAPVPVYGNISVLMQCTPDVSSKDCKLCLESSVDFYTTWHYGKRGGIILRPSCFFRWELYTFSAAFDGTGPISSPNPSSQLSPPPLKTPSVPNPTNITKKNGKSFW